MQTITQEQAAARIRQSRGRLFGVTFVKRSDGSLRNLTGRRGVTAGVKGGGSGSKFNAAAHNLLTVAEFVTDEDTPRDAKGRFNGAGSLGYQYRHIPIEGIRSLRIGGETFAVEA